MANEPRNDETVIRESESMQTEREPAKLYADDDPDEEYDMNHENRGIAIIINQENFDGGLEEAKRVGTNKDRDDVRKALETLQFEVQVLNDPTKTELFKKLEEISGKGHTNHDCLVVVVMTHGGPGVLYAKDGEYKIDELWNKFTRDSCSSLEGKPKLFFIQACRGKNLDGGTIIQDTVDAMPVDTRQHEPTSYFTVPTEPDFLVMYSTFDGHFSFRNPTNGSWFIQSLCDMLKSYGHNRELLRILSAVSENIAYNYESNVPNDMKDKKKQIPTIISMLTKAVYFRPK